FSIYGRIFGPSTGQMAPWLWAKDFWTGLHGALISPARGLLVYQPWIALATLAFVPSIRRRFSEIKRARVPAGWELVCGTAAMLYVPLVAAWAMWWGGWCWGSRLLSEAVPLFALLCVKPVAALWISG